jgi:hypothetical protein
MSNAIVFLPLSQGKVAVIDADDFELVGRVKWTAVKSGRNFYATRTVIRADGRTQSLRLHSALNPGWDHIDHRDGDGLNNRRLNLRESSHQKNQKSFCRKRRGATSQYRGVSRNRRDQNWSAYLGRSGRNRFLGYFPSELEAAQAFDRAARLEGFEREALNFP